MIDQDFADDSAICRTRCEPHGHIDCALCRHSASPQPPSPTILRALLDPQRAWQHRDEDDAWDEAADAGLVFAYWDDADVGGPWGPTHLGLTEKGDALLAWHSTERAFHAGWSPERGTERRSATEAAYRPGEHGLASTVSYLRRAPATQVILEVEVEIRAGKVTVGSATAVQLRVGDDGHAGDWIVLPPGVELDLLPEERADALAFGETQIGGGR